MNPAQARNAYRQSESHAKIHPVKLIHMMYERALVHLEKAGVAIVKKDPKMRGENLGKAIAIITELNASVKEDDDSDAAVFLRGLYNAILVELPKAATADNSEIVHQTITYIQRLKEIWEETAMQEAGLQASHAEETAQKSSAGSVLEEKSRKIAVGNGGVSFSI